MKDTPPPVARLRLRQERELRGWSQAYVSERIGSPASYYISRWERGITTPSPYYREKLCKLFGKNAQELGLISLQQDDPETISSPSLTPSTPAWHLPYRRNPFFTGRSSLLQHLLDVLKPPLAGAPPPSYALSGLGGVGKSQTMIEYAYRAAQQHSAVFWITAETTESIFFSLRHIADSLDLPEKYEQEPSILLAAFHRWLSRHPGWLLLADNVEESTLMKDILPFQQHGSVLLTTRLPTLGTLAHCIEMEPLSLEESVQFLLHRLTNTLSSLPQQPLAESSEEELRSLAAALDGLPLALDQAASYLDATRCSVSAFLTLFQTSPISLLHEWDPHADHPHSVVRTFQLSFEHLQHTNRAAADLLRVCCLLAPEEIPEELFTHEPDALGPELAALPSHLLSWNKVLKAALAYGLLRRQPSTQTLSIHRLIQIVIREHMTPQEQEQWATRVINVMHHLLVGVDITRWSRSQRYISQLEACIHLITHYQIYSLAAASLLDQAGHYFRLRGRYLEAEALLQRAMTMNEQLQGSEHPETGAVLLHLTELYYDLGRYEEAMSLCQRAHTIFEHSLGNHHPLTANALANLAMLSQKQGKTQQVEALLRQALTIFEHTSETRIPGDYAATLEALAHYYYAQGMYLEAEPLYQRALTIEEEEYAGVQSSAVATTLNHLGLLYTALHKYEEAADFLQRSLAIYEQILGPEHAYTAVVLHNLGRAYRDQKRYSEAERLLRRALAIYEQSVGLQHAHVALTLNVLGDLASKQRRFEEAEQLLKRALTICERALGFQHRTTGSTLLQFGQFYALQRRYEEAERWYQRALEHSQQHRGLNHSDTAKALKRLGVLYSEQGQDAQAEPLPTTSPGHLGAASRHGKSGAD